MQMPSVVNAPSLTPNAVELMLNQQTDSQVTVQLLQFKKLSDRTANQPPRYRLQISDGEHSCGNCMLATQKNDLIESGQLDSFAVILVKKYISNKVSNKKFVVLVELEVLTRGCDVGKAIGNPTALKDGVPRTTAASNLTQELSGRSSSSSSFATTGQEPSPPSGKSKLAQSFPASSAASHTVCPIMALTPYQHKWCILVRVTQKSPIKTWSNSRGEGKLFSVNLADESGEIRATGFNQECDRLYNIFQPKQVYYISLGQVKAANRQYTSIANDYEIAFTAESKVEPCFDDSIYRLPTMSFNFVRFDQLASVSRDRLIDVIGVVERYGEVETLTQRSTNKELKKRSVYLVDDSSTAVTLALWGENAEKFECDGHPVLAVKGVRVGDYSGISLSLAQGSETFLNPDIKEAHRLRGWYDSEAKLDSVKNLSVPNAGATAGAGGAGSGYTLLAVAEAERLGSGDKADFFTVKAMVIGIKRDTCLYQACPTPDCKKKVVDENNGMYRCEKCNKHYPNFKWRILLSVHISDSTSSQWVTMFEDCGETLLGTTAEVLGGLREQNEEEFNALFENILFNSYKFRLRCKMETFNDEARMRVTCAQLEQVPYPEYIRHLISDIQKLKQLPTPD